MIVREDHHSTSDSYDDQPLLVSSSHAGQSECGDIKNSLTYFDGGLDI